MTLHLVGWHVYLLLIIIFLLGALLGALGLLLLLIWQDWRAGFGKSGRGEQRRQQKPQERVVVQGQEQEPAKSTIVQCEAVSALFNLGMSYKQAEEAVASAIGRHPNSGIDQIIRSALVSVVPRTRTQGREWKC